MFVASKYEEVVPIYMNTMTKRVSHNKLSENQISSAEKELCTTLRWRLSSCPTSLEYLTIYLSDEHFKFHCEVAFLKEMGTFLCLLCLHHI
jgi:hypothetical protein